MNPKTIIFLASLLVCLTFSFGAEAAKLYFVPDAKTVAVGDEFSLELDLDTEGASINAGQATVHFQNTVLELVGVSRVGSVFSFWLEEPSVSNTDGLMVFIGGTPKGVQGQTLHLLTLRFRALSQGSGGISFSEAIIAASDGKGTNVLSATLSPAVTVGEAVAVAPAPVAEQPVEILKPEEPVVITREPVRASQRPGTPNVKAPLYPDQSRWYDHLGDTMVFWDVPDDVTKIATALDRNPDTSPENIETELFTGKSFGVLQEGIWYVHVQFRNNVGWGAEAHYKISIDLTPPLPFEIGIDQEVSDNPTPKLSFETFDSLSGVAQAFIYLDGQEPIESQEVSLTLSPQPPGKHAVKVRFVDKAGNGVEDDLEFEILPLQTPVIEFVTKRVSRGESVFISGTGLPGSFVDLRVYGMSGQEAFKTTTQADGLGKWGLSLKELLPLGKYTVVATTRDERGALSHPAPAQEFMIRPQIIFSLGLLDLGWFEIFLIVVLMILAGIGLYGWYWLGLKKRREAYAIIVARDIEKMHNLLEENLDKMEGNIKNLEKFFSPVSKTMDPSLKEESLMFIKKMRGVLDKMKKYVKKEVEELK